MEVTIIVSSYRTQYGPEYQRWEDSQNGLPPVPVGGNEFCGNSVRGGVRAINDRIRSFLPGETACSGTVHGVRGGDGDRVSGIPYIDTSWEGNGLEMALGKHSPQRGAMYLQDGLPNHWGTAELPYRGVSGTGGNVDRAVG